MLLQSNNGAHEFDMALPHAMSVQFDYNVVTIFLCQCHLDSKDNYVNPRCGITE